MSNNIEDLPVRDIMTRWPETIRVFMAFRTHCIGCPIAGFHTMTDTALEHGLNMAAFRAAIRRAIASGPGSHHKPAQI